MKATRPQDLWTDSKLVKAARQTGFGRSRLYRQGSTAKFRRVTVPKLLPYVVEQILR
jgi:hypothetical protein